MPKLPYTVVQNESIIIRVPHDGAVWELTVTAAVAGVEPTGRTLPPDQTPEFQVSFALAVQTRKDDGS